MTPIEILNTKLSANELSFLLVTYMVDSDAWFGSYGILESGQGAENILDRLVIPVNGQVSEHKILKVLCSSFQHLLILTFPTPSAMVMAISVQPRVKFAVF
jgi:hypothetical protein